MSRVWRSSRRQINVWREHRAWLCGGGERALQKAKGNANSLALDIHAQWAGFESNGQWRFTPPTQVLAALDQAISEHKQEGGVAREDAGMPRIVRF